MGNYETLNELLVTLFRDVMDIEQKVIITPEFKDITNNSDCEGSLLSCN